MLKKKTNQINKLALSRELLARGKAEGLAEGKYAVAKNMLELGLPVDFIAKTTKLTEEEIGRLRE